MKRFHLLYAQGDEQFLGDLQALGVVEVAELPGDLGMVPSSEGSEAPEDVRRKVDFLRDVLKCPEESGSGRVAITREEERRIAGGFPLDDVHRRFQRLNRLLERREKTAEKIRKMEKELLPLKSLQVVPAELYSLRNFSFLTFTLPASRERQLEQLEKMCALQRVSPEVRPGVFLVIFPTEDRKKIEDILVARKARVLPLRCYRRPVPDVLARLAEMGRRNERFKETLREQMGGILSWRKDILVLSDHLATLRLRDQVRRRIGVSRYVRGMAGWVRDRDMGRLKAFLRNRVPDHYLSVRDPLPGEDVPVALDNPPAVQPFEIVTDLYGRPDYRNLDPTAPLSFFFLLCFGFCLTDAGYGLVLVLAAWLLMKKFRSRPAALRFFRLLFYSGWATAVMGAATGGWFGDAWKSIPEGAFLRRIPERLILLDPLESGEKARVFLQFALVVGYVQILWGLVLGAYHTVRRYGLRAAQEPLLVLSIQILMAVLLGLWAGVQRGFLPPASLRVTGTVIGLNFLYLMVVKARSQKGMLIRMFWALYGAYSVLAGNLLGDVLSYSRLFGLGLTTAVLALVVNQVAGLASGVPYVGVPAAVLILLVGHGGNLCINLLGSYVHTSRLQYLEFFTKFFESGGRPFSPFAEVRACTVVKSQG